MIPRVEKVVDEITFHRGRFEDFCRSLSEEELARPVPEQVDGQDYIAHLATIDQTVTRWFDALARGGTPPREPASHRAGHGFDIDTWNNGQVAKRSSSTVDELFAEAARTARDRRRHGSLHRRGHRRRDLLPGDKPPAHEPQARALPARLGQARPTHVRDQLRALPERQADPALVSWLEEAKILSGAAVGVTVAPSGGRIVAYQSRRTRAAGGFP